MCRGCDAHHHPQALRRFLSALSAAILVAVSVGFVRAEPVQKVSESGVVHRVQAESLSGPSVAGGTLLRHTIQLPDGSETSLVLPGTEDFFVDREPDLEIDPATDHPVVVWSRHEGADFDIFLSRFDGIEWSAPLGIFQGVGDDREPEVRITDARIHVIWNDLGISFFHLNLDRLTLAPVYGPELLPTEGVDLLDPGAGGVDEVSPSPPTDAIFFTAAIDVITPGTPPRMFVWGVRDEPVPVGYTQGFLLDSELSPLGDSSAGWIGQRFSVWFTSPAESFSYSFRDNGCWTSFRRVMLGENTQEYEAKSLVREMLVRIGPDLPD